MSWLNALVPFAVGMVKGFAAELARPEPPSRSSSSSPSNGLSSLLIAYGRAARLGPPRIHDRSVGFTVHFEGVPYMVLFSPGPGCVIASAHSNLSFPGPVPRPIEKAIEGLNRKDDSGCVYDTVDHDDGISLCSITRVDLDVFSERAFNLMVTTLTRRVAVLDRVLVQHGYAA